MVAFADILEYFLPLFPKVISQFWYLKFETLILSELTWAKSTSAWVIQFSQLCLFRKCLFPRAAAPSLPLPFLLFFLHFFYDAGMKSGALCMLGKRSKLTNEDSISHWIAQTGLELTVLPSVTLNSRSSCLAPNSGMIRRMPYVLPAWILDASVDLNLWPRFWALCTVSSLASWVCLATGPVVLVLKGLQSALNWAAWSPSFILYVQCGFGTLGSPVSNWTPGDSVSLWCLFFLSREERLT